jgi:hypothetical protein
MSKAEILAELPKLGIVERREIFERMCELADTDLINGEQPDAEEKALLDRELAELEKDPEAGFTWPEVEALIRQKDPL